MQLVYPPNYQAPLADWPEPRAAVPMNRCAVLNCQAEKSLETRNGREVMRRWCEEHAIRYDAEVARRGTPAPVFSIATGERVA